MKRTIGKKLGMGFASLVFLIFISMGVTIFLILCVNATSDHLVEEQFPSMKAFNEYKMQIQDRSSYYERYILTGDKVWLEYLEDTQKKYNKALQNFLAHPLKKDEWKLINEYQALIENYYMELDKIVEYVKLHPDDKEGTYKLLLQAFKYRNETGPIFKKLVENKQSKTNTMAAELQNNLNTTRTISAISGILAILIGSFLSYFLGRSLSRPIVSLTKIADAISLGNFSTPININTNDEIEDLAKAIARMSKSLQKAMKRFKAK